MSYYIHALTSKEYLQGKNSRLMEVFCKAETTINNPYSYGGDESIKWLSWKLGYESVRKNTVEAEMGLGGYNIEFLPKGCFDSWDWWKI
jgi:hypothetical protein